MAPGIYDHRLPEGGACRLYLPESYRPAVPIPLVVMLPGAGSSR